jgi:catechol 2,3-dioxygenase-like lactoylglutathione lyase family enzyme
LTTDSPSETITHMPAPGRLVAFAATRDLARAQRFYTDQLGLTLVEANPAAVVLDSGGVQLRVTLVAEKTAAPYTVLGWQVDDLTAAVAELRARGVSFHRYPGMDQDGDDAWTAPDGTRVAWFPDPDANLLSLSQHPR